MNLVKQAREDRQWSQARLVSELCRQARELGETLPARESLKTMLSRWENDRVVPDVLYQQLLARAFSCSPEQLGLTGRWAGAIPPAGAISATSCWPFRPNHRLTPQPGLVISLPRCFPTLSSR